jgi:hypothetical protein
MKIPHRRSEAWVQQSSLSRDSQTKEDLTVSRRVGGWSPDVAGQVADGHLIWRADRPRPRLPGTSPTPRAAEPQGAWRQVLPSHLMWRKRAGFSTDLADGTVGGHGCLVLAYVAGRRSAAAPGPTGSARTDRTQQDARPGGEPGRGVYSAETRKRVLGLERRLVAVPASGLSRPWVRLGLAAAAVVGRP